MTASDSEVLAGVRIRRDAIRVALGELERALAGPSTASGSEWARTVGEAAATLRDAFDAHVAQNEGDDGLFADVMERAPRLAHRVADLQKDHDAISHSLGALIDDLSATTAPAVEEIRREAVDVMAQVVRHRHLGSELVYEAYVVDIEAAD